ncbi:hypothetical protein [Pedobacter jeongneungensis]|uniref:hypothetical protein n=1 Tax=Pedobacter jeongneungensis TaxID=947309 RepID=UPI0004691DA6|nr:hypothetical protein [Pedobacter jeongneungensis]
MKKNIFGGKAALAFADPRFVNHNYKSAEDLEREAGDLSNFHGGGIGYVGQGDQFLDFAGSGVSLASAARNAKPFIITFTNANAAPREVLICPGLIRNAVGLMVTGAFNDTSGNAGLSAQSGSPGPVEFFNAFIDKFPSVVSGIKIATQNLAQMDQALTLVKESPFQNHSSKVITPGIYASEGNFNTAILTIPEPFYLTNEHKVRYTVLGSTTVVITFMIGVSLNISKALRSKVETAKTNIENAGGAAVVSKFIG